MRAFTSELLKRWKGTLLIPIAIGVGIYTSHFIASGVENANDSLHQKEYSESLSVAATELISGFGRAIAPSVIASSFEYNYPLSLALFDRLSPLEFENKAIGTLAYVLKRFQNETFETELELSELYGTNITLSHIDYLEDDMWIIAYTYPFVDFAIGLNLNSQIDRSLAITDLTLHGNITVSKPLEIGTGEYGIFSLEPVRDPADAIDAFLLRLFTVENFFGSDIFEMFVLQRSVPYQVTIDGSDLVRNATLPEGGTTSFSGTFEGIEIVVAAPSAEPVQNYRHYYGLLMCSGVLITSLVVAAMLLNLRASVQAEKTVELKGRFITDMSHEIRTPMNGIMGSTEMMLEYPMEDALVEYLRVIQSCGAFLLNIINDILDMSKMEAGMMDIGSEEFNLISDTLQVLRNTKISFETSSPNSIMENVETSLDICKRFPLQVKGDPIRYRQVLSNIYMNAMRFTDRGSIKIHAKCTPVSNMDVAVEISVSDTGIGMSPKNAIRCFESFVQVHSQSRDIGGTGLGLSLCKKLLSLMGGSVECTSEVGKGSTFTLKMKMAGRLNENPPPDNYRWVFSKENRHLIDNEISEGLRSDSSVSDSSSEKEPLVLIVDDNKINRVIASKLLESMGVPSHTCDNGIQAVELCETTKFSLVLMDMVMPMMDGETATRTIRSSQTNPNRDTPILFLTANVGRHYHDLCIQAGGNAVITKPMDKKTLLTSMAVLVTKEEASWMKKRYMNASSFKKLSA